MTDFITRCPKCQTSFHVNEAHLKTARGAVRCGSCLNVFNAKENLSGKVGQAVAPKTPKNTSANAPKAEAKREKTAPQTKVASKTKTAPPTKEVSHREVAPALKQGLDEDDLLIDDDMGEEDTLDALEDELNTNVFVASTTMSTNTNLFERIEPDLYKEETENTDESWALNLLDDDSDETTTKQAKPTPSASSTQKHAEKKRPKSPNSDNNLFQLMDDEEPEEDIESLFQEKPRTKHEYDEDYDEFLDGREEVSYETSFTNPYLDAIEPEPLEIHAEYKRPLHQSPLLWFGLSLIAAVAALAQLAYFQFDELSRDNRYRSYYAKSCEVFNCKLPAMEDRSKIRVANIVVSEDPESSDTLIVEAVLLNLAHFEQNFPNLRIHFSDIRDKNISIEEFSPSTYVGGELAGARLMPKNQPIHVTVKAKDPGSNAVNYRISLF
ncbi:MAG: putative Zn finger-like uncharacterized protein [Flavobacteriales bacterium]|jgi:predicted Zn finger-like uncharacterized protein